MESGPLSQNGLHKEQNISETQEKYIKRFGEDPGHSLKNPFGTQPSGSQPRPTKCRTNKNISLTPVKHSRRLSGLRPLTDIDKSDNEKNDFRGFTAPYYKQKGRRWKSLRQKYIKAFGIEPGHHNKNPFDPLPSGSKPWPTGTVSRKRKTTKKLSLAPVRHSKRLSVLGPLTNTDESDNEKNGFRGFTVPYSKQKGRRLKSLRQTYIKASGIEPGHHNKNPYDPQPSGSKPRPTDTVPHKKISLTPVRHSEKKANGPRPLTDTDELETLNDGFRGFTNPCNKPKGRRWKSSRPLIDSDESDVEKNGFRGFTEPCNKRKGRRWKSASQKRNEYGRRHLP